MDSFFVCLSRTNIVVSINLFWRAFIRRLAAIAAPPIRSEVLRIRIFTLSEILINSKNSHD